jgi:hypoxanthine phosphoribosyltransferase
MLEISWEQYNQDVNELAHKINGNPADEWPILAIGRGGLIPAVMLSHMLGNGQRVYSFDCQSYTPDNQSSTLHMQKWPPFEKGAFKEILIVDDLIHRGITLYNIKRMLPAMGVVRAEFAVVYVRNKGVADSGKIWFGRNLECKEWIQFPYERRMI